MNTLLERASVADFPQEPGGEGVTCASDVYSFYGMRWVVVAFSRVDRRLRRWRHQ